MALLRTSIQIGKAFYPHYYLCRYLPVSAGRDTLSHSLLKFKLGRQPDLSAWIDCILETLSALPILPHTTIVRALHHDEIAFRQDHPTSLDKLGAALATRFHSHYRPSLLCKRRTTRQIKGFSIRKRETELRDLYYIGYPSDQSAQPDQSARSLQSAQPGQPALSTLPDPFSFSPTAEGPILILDDILTTGSTITAILAALHPYFPRSSFSIFTLARATYDPRPNDGLPVKGQNYQLEQGMDWVMAEEDASVYRPAYSASQLTAWINAGDFP